MSNPLFSQFTCLIYKEFFGDHYTFGPSTDLSKNKDTTFYYISKLVRALWLVNLAGRTLLHGPPKFKDFLLLPSCCVIYRQIFSTSEANNSLSTWFTNLKQIDGVAMKSIWGPDLANIFMCHFEESWLIKNQFRPSIWFRYVDRWHFLLIWQ